MMLLDAGARCDAGGRTPTQRACEPGVRRDRIKAYWLGKKMLAHLTGRAMLRYSAERREQIFGEVRDLPVSIKPVGTLPVGTVGQPMPGGSGMSGWEGSNRRARLPDDWPQRRAAILKRDPTCRLRIVCQGAPSTAGGRPCRLVLRPQTRAVRVTVALALRSLLEAVEAGTTTLSFDPDPAINLQPGGGGLCLHSIATWPGEPDSASSSAARTRSTATERT